MMMSGSWRNSVLSAEAKVMPALGLDRGLVEGLDHHLDGVLDGRDVDRGCGDLLQGRIEGGGLARAGGAAHEHNAVGPLDPARVELLLGQREA
jgi:hypothetical protein